jgi:hypothetical protein
MEHVGMETGYYHVCPPELGSRTLVTVLRYSTFASIGKFRTLFKCGELPLFGFGGKPRRRSWKHSSLFLVQGSVKWKFFLFIIRE